MAVTLDFSDRRSTPRTDARFEVRFVRADDAARALRAYSLNLSAGGLCLKTRRLHEVGTRLELSLDVGGQTFALKGEVAWARGGAIGVRFVDLTAADKDRLAALASSLRQVG